jgi:hypothetical protein
MASFFDSGPLPDWQEIRNMIGPDFPWSGKNFPWKLVKQWEKARDNSWLSGYIDDLVQRTAPQEPRFRAKEVFKAQTSKSDKSVTVTLTLPKSADMRSLRLLAGPDRLKVIGLGRDSRHVVRLPCLVYPRSGKASMKRSNQLQVRFRRQPPLKDEVELFIRP